MNIKLHTIKWKCNGVDIVWDVIIWFVAVSFIHLVDAAGVCSSASYVQTVNKANVKSVDDTITIQNKRA